MATFGVGEAIMAIGAAAGVASDIDASNKQHAAARDQKDEQAMARNKQSAEDAQTRRAAIREERVRRAQIMQSAANAGAAGSSGEGNSISNLSASIGANLSGVAGGAQTASQMSFMDNQAQNNLDSANASLAVGSTISGLANTAATAYNNAQARPPKPPTSKLTEQNPPQ